MAAATQFQGLATPGSLISRGRESNCGMSRRRGRLPALSSVYSRASGGDLSPLVNRQVHVDGRCIFCEFTGIRRISPVVKNQVKHRGFLVRAEFNPGSDVGYRDAEGQVNPVSIKDERRQLEDPAHVNSAVTDSS